MIEIPLPRLLDNTGAEIRRITPLHASVTLNKTPLSTASLELPAGEKLNNRAWVEMYTINGSAGIFRVASPQTGYGNQRGAVDLEHGAAEIGDSIVSTPTSGTYTVAQAFSTLFSFYKGTRWQLGTVEATGTIVGDWDGENVLEAMIALLEQIPGYHLEFVQTTTPWTVNVRQDPAVVSAEGRLDRNVSNAIVAEDGTSQVTRLYMEGLPGGYIEADNISQVGVIERFLAGGGEDLTPESAAQLEADARRYINKHKNPLKSVQISGYDFYAVTGESLDKLELCKLYRLELPEDNTTISANISSLTFDDVYGDPYSATVTLDEPDFGISAVLSRIEQELGISGGYGGVGSGRGQRKIQEETHYRHEVKETTQGMEDCFGVIGVKLDTDHKPMKDALGNYIWAGPNDAAAEIWGHLHRNAWETQILNHITDANGKVLSLAEVYTDAYGNAIISAINDQRTGTAAINANRIKLQATDTITLDALLGIEAQTQQLRVIGDLYVDNTVWATDISALSSIHSDITIDAPTIEGGYGRFQNLYCKSTFDQYGELTGGEDVSAAFKDMQFIVDPQNSGHFILQGKTLANPNAWVNVTNFNIADTAFYNNGVSAARTQGQQDHTASSISSITIYAADAGQVVTKYPYVTYSNGDTSSSLALSVDATAISGGGAVRLLVRQNAGATVTELINGQRVTLTPGEYCEVDIEQNGSYVKWGEVAAPSGGVSPNQIFYSNQSLADGKAKIQFSDGTYSEYNLSIVGDAAYINM